LIGSEFVFQVPLSLVRSTTKLPLQSRTRQRRRVWKHIQNVISAARRDS
jgi:hypothetical protein